MLDRAVAAAPADRRTPPAPRLPGNRNLHPPSCAGHSPSCHGCGRSRWADAPLSGGGGGR